MLDPHSQKQSTASTNRAALKLMVPFFRLLRVNLLVAFVCALVVVTPFIAPAVVSHAVLLGFTSQIAGVLFAVTATQYWQVSTADETYKGKPIKEAIIPSTVVAIGGSIVIHVWMLWTISSSG